MHHNVIKDGAIFVADSHLNDEREDLYCFLKDLLKSPPPQLFLMGDIFDLLIGAFPYLIDKNRKTIEIIEELGTKTEIYFFEGNHDFLLENSIKNIKYIPLSKQPMEFLCNEQKVYLSHGDYSENLLHTIFTSLIRSRQFLFLLHLGTFNFLNNWFVKKVSKDLKKKKLCSKFENFDKYIEQKIAKTIQSADIVIEGHYHQNCDFFTNNLHYINIAGFACNQSYIVVEFFKDKIKFTTCEYKR